MHRIGLRRIIAGFFFMIVVITIVLAVVAFIVSQVIDRRQTAASAPAWIPLATLIAGRVEGTGVRGIYHERLVTALLEPRPVGTDQYWNYVVTLGASAPATGQSWDVEYTGAEPLRYGGSDALWPRLLAGISADDRRATGFTHFSYNARKGELSGSNRSLTASGSSHLRDYAKIPPPPPAGTFRVQLDFLLRLAELNQSVNSPAV